MGQMNWKLREAKRKVNLKNWQEEKNLSYNGIGGGKKYMHWVILISSVTLYC